MANWDKITSSGNVEDRRGSAPVAGGLGTIGVILVLGFMLFGGGDTQQVEQLLSEVTANQPGATSEEFAGDDSYEVFATKVLGSNNDLWREEFSARNRTYQVPRLVLFRGSTQSGCGFATSKVGPHYCPLDQTIYLDETFFDELQSRFGAKGGDVAEAYVIAHEVGHHVQNIVGTFDKVDRRDNSKSIGVELQADCYAGIWAGRVGSQGVLEKGEISEAVDAAEAVGDDRIQESVNGQINPETWTHGSSAERKMWFLQGYESGSPDICNTI